MVPKTAEFNAYVNLVEEVEKSSQKKLQEKNVLYLIQVEALPNRFGHLPPVLRIRIRIRMNPHGFGLQDPHPESAFQMRIPDADADSD